MFTITRKHSFNEDTFLLEFHLPAIAEKARPGQYADIHINVDGQTVTLPIVGVDRDAGTFTVIEQGRDLPSEQLMVLAQGEEVFQIRGPLGAPCEIDADGRVVLVGEDLGVASLLWRAREFKAAGATVIAILGFASRDRVFFRDEFAEIADELYITTLDGTFGVSGRVTGPLQAVCETHRDIERLVMIAKLKSMKRGAKIAADNRIDARVSFDAIRYPAGSPGVFDTAENAADTFAFMRAAELNADVVDFDKLLGRERALSAQSAAADEDEAENARSRVT